MPTLFRSARSSTIARAAKAPERSPTERGYGNRWKRASKAYRRKHPFCAMCKEQGKLTLVVEGKTGVVDHKYPVSDGGPIFDPSNWWVLCVSHHSVKARWERLARETGRLNEIVSWCDDPERRPAFRGDPQSVRQGGAVPATEIQGRTPAARFPTLADEGNRQGHRTSTRFRGT